MLLLLPRPELASTQAGGEQGASLCLQPQALSQLLHVDICVSCEFSATSWPGTGGEVAGMGLWPRWSRWGAAGAEQEAALKPLPLPLS